MVIKKSFSLTNSVAENERQIDKLGNLNTCKQDNIHMKIAWKFSSRRQEKILFIENYQYPANHNALEDIFCIPECSKQVVKKSSRQLSIIQKNYKELSRTDQNYDWVC